VRDTIRSDGFASGAAEPAHTAQRRRATLMQVALGLLLAAATVSAAPRHSRLDEAYTVRKSGVSALHELRQHVHELRQHKFTRPPTVLIPEYEHHEPTAGPRNQQFGGQIALSADGRTLAVADLWYYGGSEWPWYGSGAVYVYRHVDSSWTLQAKLEPPAARGYDFFGSDLALNASGDTLAVGAQYEGYEAPSQDAGPGSVFVFKRRNGTWTQEAMLRATRPQDSASFGRSVEISARGNVIAVGAPYETVDVDGVPAYAAGAVYVFKRHETQWQPPVALEAPNPKSHDQFGHGVRLSDDGRTIAVLAAEENYETEDLDNGGWPNRNNTVYVFGRNAGEWTLQAEFEGSADDPAFGGSSYETEGQVEGFDLSADGRTLAIASPFAAAPDGGHGLVRLYKRADDNWTPTSVVLTPALSERIEFGSRLTLSNDGNTLVATANRDDGPYGRPYVVVFARTGHRWSQAAALEPSQWPDYTSFGNALAVSATGKRLAVGSRAYPMDDSWWGAALVF
jgi:hypothetical protein